MNKILISREGYEIPYVFEGTGDEKKVVIISHGFGSSKESNTAVTVAEKMRSVGIASVRYDFPAHGSSPVDGEFFRIENCISDLRSVEEMVAENMPEAEIYYFSSSFGAFINLNYLSSGEHRGTRSFLRCSAVGMPEIAEGWMDEGDRRREMEENDFIIMDEDYSRPLKCVRGLLDDFSKINLYTQFKKDDTELLMIHGTADITAPYEDAVRFSQKYGIDLISVEGAEHTFIMEGAMDRVRQEAAEFFLREIR